MREDLKLRSIKWGSAVNKYYCDYSGCGKCPKIINKILLLLEHLLSEL